MKYKCKVFNDSSTEVNRDKVEAASFEAAALLMAEYTEEIADEHDLMTAHWRIELVDCSVPPSRTSIVVARQITVQHKIESRDS